MKTFREELTGLINRHSKETESNTPDFLLAAYLDNCLNTYNLIIDQREKYNNGGELVKYNDGIILVSDNKKTCPRCSQNISGCECSIEKGENDESK